MRPFVTRRFAGVLWLASVAACNALVGNEEPHRVDSPSGGEAGADASTGGASSGGASTGGAGGAPTNGEAGFPSDGGSPAEAGAGNEGGAGNQSGAPPEPEGGSAGAVPPTDEAPAVLAVTPANDENEVEPGATIELTFSEPVDPETLTAENVSVEAVTGLVGGELDYSGVTAVFTPHVPLSLLEEYTVTVSTAVTDADGTPLAEPFESSFRVRDGAWQSQVTITQAAGPIVPVGAWPAAPVIDAYGNALVVWTQASQAGAAQSVWARRYQRGSGWGDSFEVDQTTFPCREATVATSPWGDALIVWVEAQDEDQSAFRVMARRYLDGELEAAALPVDAGASGSPATGLTTAVSDIGQFHAFWRNVPAEAPGFTYVYHALGERDVPLSPYSEVSTSWNTVDGPVVGFDAEGNGFVAFRGTNVESSIALRRYAASTGYGPELGIIGSAGAVVGPSLAVAPHGDAVLAWSDSDVKASHFTAADGWSEAVALESRAGAPVENSVGVAWAGTRFLAGFAQSAGALQNAFVTSFDGTSWSSDELVSDGNASATFYSRVAVGGDSAGHASVLWVDQPESFDAQRVMSRRLVRGSGEWSAPELVSTGAATYVWGSIDVAELGSVVALWQDFESYELYAAVFD